MKSTIIIILLMFPIIKGWAQKIEEITHREVNVHFNDSSIKANVLLEEKRVRLKNSVDYYWYHNNSIKTNQGDYKGRLLDGDYKVSTQKGNLIMKGSFEKGSRSGEWKRWTEKGQLTLIDKWKNGVRNGAYQKYSAGKLVEKGVYRKGLLHGKKIVYQSDSVFSITAYKKGEEVVKKEKKEKEEENSIKEDEKEKNTPFWKNNKEKEGDLNKKPKNKKKLKKAKKTGEKKAAKEKKKPRDKSEKKD